MSPLKSVRRALTLLELVVVLGILAIIAGVTIQSLEPIADQARYDATVQTLEAIERAIYREQQVSADRVMIRGFVADMGRLPRAVGDDALFHSAELWDRAASGATANPFSIQPFEDPEIFGLEPRVAAGWNGPYLQPPRDGRMQDGWGQPLVYSLDGATLLSGAPLVTVRSTGADGVLDSHEASGGSNYSADLPQSPAELDHRIAATLDVELKERCGTGLVPAEIDSGRRLYVFVLGPVDGAPGRVFPPVDQYDESVHSSPTPNLFTKTSSSTPTEFTPGPRTLVTWLATGTWPNLTRAWSDERTVTLFPGHNVIQIVKPAAAGAGGGP